MAAGKIIDAPVVGAGTIQGREPEPDCKVDIFFLDFRCRLGMCNEILFGNLIKGFVENR